MIVIHAMKLENKEGVMSRIHSVLTLKKAYWKRRIVSEAIPMGSETLNIVGEYSLLVL